MRADWRFDEGSGSTAADSSGNGNTAPLGSGTMFTAAAKQGPFAVQFTGGSTSRLTAPDNLSLDIAGTAFSLEAWVYATGCNSGYAVLLMKLNQYSLALHNTGSGCALTYADSVTFSYAAISDHGAVSLNTWHHVVVTLDGSALRFYVDGVQQGAALSRSGVLVTTTNAVVLGAYDTAGSYPLPNGSRLDEVVIWARTLSDADVAARFANAPAPTAAPTSSPTVPPANTATASSTSAPTNSPTRTPTNSDRKSTRLNSSH
jgi:hypothetical protein